MSMFLNISLYIVFICINFGFSLSAIADTEVRLLKGFDRIYLKRADKLVLTQGEKFEVKVHAPKEILAKAITVVNERTLMLFLDGDSWFRADDIKKVSYEVTMPRIDRVTLAGSGTIHAERIVSDYLKIDNKGYGDIFIGELVASKVNLLLRGNGNISLSSVLAVNVDSEAEGSGEIRADGEAKHIRVRIRGSGGFIGEDFSSESADIKVYGSGNVVIRKADVQSSKAYGSGSILFLEN